MDVSSTSDINVDLLNTGITAGPSTIKLVNVNVSNDSVFLIASQVGINATCSVVLAITDIGDRMGQI